MIGCCSAAQFCYTTNDAGYSSIDTNGTTGDEALDSIAVNTPNDDVSDISDE